MRLTIAFNTNEVNTRDKCVRSGMLKSLSVLLVCGVPRGSVLGPILFAFAITAQRG